MFEKKIVKTFKKKIVKYLKKIRQKFSINFLTTRDLLHVGGGTGADALLSGEDGFGGTATHGDNEMRTEMLEGLGRLVFFVIGHKRNVT